MPYVPVYPPNTNNPELERWLFEELQNIAGELAAGAGAILLPELNVEPDKPRKGMIVLADGTNWDPGSGAGFYGYDGTSWNILG